MKISLQTLLALTLLPLAAELTLAAQLSVGIETDLSKPTLGLHGPTTSQVTYDEHNGLNLHGAIQDILGPPIKIANGFNNMLAGSNLAGMGASLKSGSAVLGIDAKMLEAAGGANLLKGGLLLGGAAGKTGAAAVKGGPAGKKISSIIEVPVKVVAMKDLATGKALTELGKVKGAEAAAAKTKGASMMKQGDQLKQQGMSQVLQGASEGMQNIGNMVQQTANNAASAVRFLPIILDLPMGQQPEQQTQQVVDQSKGRQQDASTAHLSQPGALTGGSLFGGLTSLLPGLGQADPFAQAGHNPFNNLFGNLAGHNGYAAVLNTTSPLTSLLMNPNLNPLLLPMQIAGGPLGQSLMSKQPAGTADAKGAAQQASTFNYNLFPGFKVSENMSSRLPGQLDQQVQQQQQQQKSR